MKTVSLVLLLAANLFGIGVNSQLCKICADGSSPHKNIDGDLGLYSKSGFDTSHVTCGNVQDYIERNAIPDYQMACHQIEDAGIQMCGCPERQDKPCNLCEDEGSNYDPYLPSLFLGDGNTCSDDAVSFSGRDRISCLIVQATVGVSCGCSNPIAISKLECPMCGAGIAIPDPARTFRAPFSSENITCAAAEFADGFFSSCVGPGSKVSPYYQESVKYCCAKEAPPTNTGPALALEEEVADKPLAPDEELDSEEEELASGEEEQN